MNTNKKLDLDYDYLSLHVKREKLSEVKARYQVFSWEILSSSEHDFFGSIIELEMRRPHKIKDKDKLQFLQVQMEFLLNEQEKVQKYKHKKSSIFGLTWGLMCALIFALSLVTILKSASLVWTIVGSLFAIIGFALGVVVSLVVRKIIKCEKLYYKKTYLKLKKTD